MSLDSCTATELAVAAQSRAPGDTIRQPIGLMDPCVDHCNTVDIGIHKPMVWVLRAILSSAVPMFQDVDPRRGRLSGRHRFCGMQQNAFSLQ